MVEMKVRQGGLLRCCLQTLAEHLDEITEVPPVGTILDCKFEMDKNNGNLILASDGVWEWNKKGRAG